MELNERYSNVRHTWLLVLSELVINAMHCYVVVFRASGGGRDRTDGAQHSRPEEGDQGQGGPDEGGSDPAAPPRGAAQRRAVPGPRPVPVCTHYCTLAWDRRNLLSGTSTLFFFKNGDITSLLTRGFQSELCVIFDQKKPHRNGNKTSFLTEKKEYNKQKNKLQCNHSI